MYDKGQERQVMMMKTYCFKPYHAKHNKKLHKRIDFAACAYNHCIALHKRYYRLFGKHLHKYKLQKHLTKLKKIKRFSYLNTIGSQALQDVTDRIELAYTLFFRNLKRKNSTAPPSFKKKRKYKSFTLKQVGWKLDEENGVIIINGQKYRYFKSRTIQGKIKTVTVKRDTLGDIYVYFVCEDVSNKVLTRTGNSVGLDFGLKTFLTASDGNTIHSPLFFKQNANAIKMANRSLSRKQKGSHHRLQARLALARLHKKAANQRKDFHFKTALELCGNYALICIEDLNIKAMQKLWGRKISDLGFAAFVQILKYEATNCGSTVVEIDRFYASSQICHKCGHQHKATKDLRIRAWTCPNCGERLDRDQNAAINILKVGASTFLGEAS